MECGKNINDCPANKLEVALAEIRGQLDTMSKSNTQYESFSAENRLHVHQELVDVEAKLERIEQRLMDKISALQWEVAKLIGKWSIIILIVSALGSVAMSYMHTGISAENLTALPPKTLSGDVFKATKDEE